MSKRQYPRSAWVLMPSFKPKEVTIVEPAYPGSTMFPDYDKDSGGKSHHVTKLFPSQGAAIAHGREQIVALQADIEKRQATLKKRIAALNAAEGMKRPDGAGEGA